MVTEVSMRFAADEWLWGILLSLGLAAILIAQGVRLKKDQDRFGKQVQLKNLLTAKTSVRRTIRGVLSSLAVACAFLAAAQPQYGKGTRMLPATNLDIVLVLDYSKSMYARDVSPSRIGRAKVEVARLIRALPGARFAAVAFAGESISFPLTSDGSAIAQFFRGMEPNDLPLGGTASARALDNARQLLARDPLSKNHERVMILITDGEDLEGDPVAVARAAKAEGIRIDVVQVGGMSPEPIPNIDEQGVARGLRRSANGQIMTTALSPEGQAQLEAVALAGGGQLVRAASSEEGIAQLTTQLSHLMTEELSERVETVFADIFHYPLTVAVLLLMLETWIGIAPKRIVVPEPPRGKTPRRRPARLRATAALLLPAFLLTLLGCEPIDSVFERESPAVNEAIDALKTTNGQEASQLLIEYLKTGPCEEGVIGAGERARQLGDASFDLALAFAALSGPKLPAPSPLGSAPPQPLTNGPTSNNGPAPNAPSPESLATIDCALRMLAPLGGNKELATALRARSYYLAGNLDLLREEFAAAVSSYDLALLLAPGAPEGQGDPIGISIAYNRSLALRLLREKEEKEEDDKSEDDKSEDDKSEDDKSEDDKSEDDKSEEGKEPQAPPPEKQSPNEARDQRMLDLLEQAPTLQQHEAQKRKGQRVRGRATMEDK